MSTLAAARQATQSAGVADTGSTAPRELVSSAENLLVLLIALRDQGRLRVSDAAELLSVAPATAHRLLTTLKRYGFAEQDRQRAYLPGPRLADLRSTDATPVDVAHAAGPHLADLAGRTATTSLLVTLEGNGGRVVAGADGGRTPRLRSRVGYLLPAHTTAGGKVLLAQLSDADLLALYPDRHVRTRDGSMRDLVAVRRELGLVRRQGFAVSLEEAEQSINSVAVPVLGASGRVIASLALACSSSDRSSQHLVDLVPSARTTAAAITGDLN